MSFGAFIIRRLVGIVASFLVIATILFFLFRQVGDPLTIYATGGQMSEEQIAQIRASFGLDQPLHVQYYEYILNVLTLDFGRSFFYNVPTAEIVFERLLNTLFLTIPSIFLAYLVGIIGGVQLAHARNSFKGKSGLAIAIICRSTPRFWSGLILAWVFGVYFGLLPISGLLPTGTEFDGRLDLITMPEFYRHIILPILSLTIYMIGLPLLLMRASVLDVLNADFVRIARAKGASERAVRYKHVTRNAMLPVTTAFGIAVGFSFGGAVLVEVVFSYPGIGRLMINSVERGDYPVAQFSFLIMAALLLVMNFLVDLAYGVLDPTVRYD